MTGNVTPQYTHLYYEHWVCWDGCPDGPHDCYEVRACELFSNCNAAHVVGCSTKPSAPEQHLEHLVAGLPQSSTVHRMAHHAAKAVTE